MDDTRAGTPGISTAPIAYPYRPEPWTAPPRRVARRPHAFRTRELAAAVALVAAFDIAFWAHGPAVGGFGAAAFLAAVPVVLFMTTRVWRRSLRLGVVGALLAAVTARTFVAPTPLSVALGFVLAGAFALALRARDASVPALAASMLATLLEIPARLHGAVLGVDRILARTRLGRAFVLPIAIPVGLVAVFLGVFALANPVVASGLGGAARLLSSVIELPSFGRIVLWAIAFLAAALLVRPAVRRAWLEPALTVAEATPTSLLVARNALAGVNALFLAYNVLDARYLWTGKPPAGMSTQHYAHEGAFWLTIALVLLTGVVSFMFRGPLACDPRARIARGLAFAWMGQGLVLGLASYRRIAIHIARSGLSDLRIVGILGTSLVVVGVVLVAVKVRNRLGLSWLLRRQLDALALIAAVYAVVPTHLVSARVNVDRALGGELRPLLHAFRQARETESTTAFLPLLDHPDVRVRQGMAALLEEKHTQLRYAIERDKTWRERDVATSRVYRTLDAAMPRAQHELANIAAGDARSVLLALARGANEGRSDDELLAIPAAGRETVRENR